MDEDEVLIEVMNIYHRLKMHEKVEYHPDSDDQLFLDMIRDYRSKDSTLNEMTNKEKKQAIPLLIRKLNEEDGQVRDYARRSLVLIGKLAIPVLINSLKSEESEAISVRILGDIGEKSTLPKLTKVFWEGELGFLQAAYAIAKIAHANRNDPKVKEKILPIYNSVIEIFNDEKQLDFQRYWIPVIGKFAKAYPTDPDFYQAIPILCEFFMNDKTSEAKIALKDIGEDAVYHLVVEAFSSENTQKFMDLLEEMGKSIVPSLIRLVVEESGDHRINATAALILGRIKDKSAIPALIKSLENPIHDIRGFSAIALGKIGVDEEQLNTIIEFLENGKTWESKHGAIEALFQIRDPKSIPVLTDAIKDEDTRVKTFAIKALEKTLDKCRDIKQIEKVQKQLLSEYPPFEKDSEYDEDSYYTRAKVVNQYLTCANRIHNLTINSKASCNLYPLFDYVPMLVNGLLERNSNAQSQLLKIIDYCDSIEELQAFNDKLSLGFDQLKGEIKKVSFTKIQIRIYEIRLSLSKKLNRLSKTTGILLDDKPKPPKKGRMYQSLARPLLRNH